MRADPAHIIRQFCPDIGVKFICQVIYRAGEHEILPDHQAQLIADIIEIIVRIVTAAPDADGIHIGRPGILQKAPGPLRVYSRQKIVLRNIVGTHGEDIHAVDAVAEALAPLILLPADRHRPEADPLFPAVKLFLPVHQADAGRIKRLIAEACRPPELRIFHFDQAGFPLCLHGPSVRGRQGDFHSEAAAGCGRADLTSCRKQIRIKAAAHLSVLMILSDEDIADSGFLHADDHNIAPDPGVGKPWTPVPAEHAVGFSEQREARHGIRTAVRAGFRVCLADIAGRRIQNNRNLILSRLQKLPHIIFPGAVHVVGPAHSHAVDPDLRYGVKPFAAQQKLTAVKQILRNRESPGIIKIIFHQGKRLHLIIPVKRIRHSSRAQQVIINGSGNLRRDRRLRQAGNLQCP